jgi:hypothetical protein
VPSFFSPIFFPLCFLFCGVGSQYVPWLRNLVCRLVVALTYPHCRKTDEVRGKVVTETSLLFIVLVLLFILYCFFPCISFSCLFKLLSGSFSVFYRRIFHLVAVTFNCEYRDFLLLTIVNSSLWSFFSTLFLENYFASGLKSSLGYCLLQVDLLLSCTEG